MTHEPIGKAYDEIADTWRDEVFNKENGIEQHRRALTFRDAGGHALNVGCGANTRFNALLREHGYEIVGIDLSGQMLDIAREADPDTTLFHADICDWEAPRHYEFMTAWDSIWHVALSRQRPMMLKLMNLLTPGGVLIFSAGGVDEPGEHRNSIMGPEVYYATLGNDGLMDVIREAGCHLRHWELDQYPESHLTVIVQKPGR